MSKKLSSRSQQWAKDRQELSTTRAAYWEYVATLVRITDTKTYLEEYVSQDEFLKNEADMSRQHFALLRSACQTRQRLSTIVDTKTVENVKESQLREISKAPENKQAEVFATVMEACESEKREPTAKDFRKAAKPFLPPKKGPAEEIYEDVNDAEPSEPAWKQNTVDELRTKINDLIRSIKGVPKKPGYEMIRAHANRINLDLSNAKSAIVGCVPHQICAYCQGNDSECDGCDGRGWLNKPDFLNSPKELQNEIKNLPSGGRI